MKEIWSGSYENKKIIKKKMIARDLISSQLAEELIGAFADTYGIFFYNSELYIEDANVFLDNDSLIEERVKILWSILIARKNALKLK